MTDLSVFVNRLEAEQLTLIIGKDDQTFTSQKRGIAPLLEVLESLPDLMKGADAADKVVGKSAAMLYLKGGIHRLHATIISEPALEILQRHQVQVSFTKRVPYIINRTGDGRCPMESLVLEVDDPEIAYGMLKDAVQRMMK